MTSVVSSPTKPAQAAAIPASCSGAGAPVFQGSLASGWKATKVAGGLTSPRSIQFDSAGNMLVVQSGKGISYHKMGTDGCVTSTKMLLSQNNLNHGIAMSPDGKTLYASSMTQAYSWPYDAAAGTLGTRATIITGMVNGGSHLTRTLAIAPHAPNLLVVSHGSNANIDTATSDPKTGRAIIKVFDLSAIPSGGYNYVSGGYLAGYGQRNEVGMCFDKNNMYVSFLSPTILHSHIPSLSIHETNADPGSGASKTLATTSNATAKTYTKTTLAKKSTTWGTSPSQTTTGMAIPPASPSGTHPTSPTRHSKSATSSCRRRPPP